MQHYDLYVVAFVGFILIGFFFRNYKGTRDVKLQDVCFYLAIACVAASIFDLSPFKNCLINQDSSVFIYIGEKMKEGYVPYRDLFDHKGIVLYFIQYLGLLLPFKNYLGIWLLEIINMVLTAWLLFKVAGLFTEKRVVKYVSLMGVLLVCGFQFYTGGNYVEEWALPWICLAMYIFLRYLKKDKYNNLDIIWLGISFSVVVFLRVNMVTIWVAMMPVIIIKMICTRKYKEIIQCAKYFLIGLLIVTIPVFFYTIATGCLDDMISCYIRFNFAYSGDAGKWSNIIQSIYKFTQLIPFAIIFGSLAIIFNRTNRLLIINLFAFAVSLPFTYMSGRFDLNYGIALLPFLLPLMVCGIETVYTVFGRICKWSLPDELMESRILILGFLFVVMVAFYIQSEQLYLSQETENIRDYILQNTKENEDVLIIGSQGMSYYFMTDRRTENKYFYQTPPVKISDELCEDFLCQMDKKPSDTIVVLNKRDYWMKREDNLGVIYRYLEGLVQHNLFRMEDHGYFIMLRRIQTNF